MKTFVLSISLFVCSFGFLNAQVAENNNGTTTTSSTTEGQSSGVFAVTVITDEEDDYPFVNSDEKNGVTKDFLKHKAHLNNNSSLWDFIMSFFGVI